MKITVNRQEFLAVAQDAEKIIPSASQMDVLKCTFLSAADGKLTVAATNHEVAIERQIKADVAEEGSVIVDAHLLCGMLRLLEDEFVTFAREDHTLRVSGKSAVYTIIVFDEKEYPRMEIPFPADTVPVTGIPAMAKRTVFAVAEDNSKPQMRCVHLIFTSDGLRAVGSDSYRIAMAKGDSKSTGATDMLIPATSLEKLAQLVTNKDQLRVGTTGKTVVFMMEDPYLLFSARLMEGDYFDAEQLMSRVQSAFSVLTDAEKLRGIVQSACAVRGEQSRFCLSFKGSTLGVMHENEFGKSTAEMDVVPLSGNPAGEYWYVVDKLLDCLRAQHGTMMLEAAPNGALVMRTDDLICMQMPIREPGAIVIPAPKPKKEAKPKAEKPEPKPKDKKPANAKGKKKKEDAAVPKAA